jgi:hypothetical protein
MHRLDGDPLQKLVCPCCGTAFTNKTITSKHAKEVHLDCEPPPAVAAAATTTAPPSRRPCHVRPIDPVNDQGPLPEHPSMPSLPPPSGGGQSIHVSDDNGPAPISPRGQSIQEQNRLAPVEDDNDDGNVVLSFLPNRPARQHEAQALPISSVSPGTPCADPQAHERTTQVTGPALPAPAPATPASDPPTAPAPAIPTLDPPAAPAPATCAPTTMAAPPGIPNSGESGGSDRNPAKACKDLV